MMTFEPSAERGWALDRRMRERLAQSLGYVFEAAGDLLAVAPGGAERIAAAIRAKPQSPHRFGAYYDLVLAIEAGDTGRALQLCDQLRADLECGAASLAGIDDRPEWQAERYRRMFLSDVGMAEQPGPDLLAEYAERVAAAFRLLDAGYPELAGEIRALLREIVVAAGPEDPRALTFDGASCYMLWGAVLLNARGQTNVLDTAQALAHESGHNLLFGFCADGPLVENADEELFASPLRKDLRPMDGVVHATYVVARMHQAVSRLLESGLLDGEQQAAARKDLALHRANFDAGDGVVREGGRLTRTGAEALDAARRYMAAAA